MTWNIHAFDDTIHDNSPGGAGPLDAGLEDYEKAPHIARRVLREKYDIVMFNEAWSDGLALDPWDEGVKVPLAELLSFSSSNIDSDTLAIYNDIDDPAGAPPQTGQFPYWVSDSAPDAFGTDAYNSGLMLFSKYPPLAMPFPKGQTGTLGAWFGNEYVTVDYTCANAANTTTYPDELSGDSFAAHEAFLQHNEDECALAGFEYDNDSDFDNFASKGVVWMRVYDMHRGKPLNIFSTHTQAQDDPANIADREKQLKQALAFIRALGLEDEVVVFAGDLNVMEFESSSSDVNNPQFQQFLKNPVPGAVGLFPLYDFRDAFREQLMPYPTDPDRGYTNEGSRLDYFMTSVSASPDLGDCVQHVRVRSDFVSYPQKNDPPDDLLVGAYLSDHMPLEMTIGNKAGYCSPSKALNTPADGLYSASIPDKGGYQWIRMPANKPVLLHLTPLLQTTKPLAVEIFKTSNISDFISEQDSWPVDYDAEGGANVTLSFAFDYYVRIRAKDRISTGSFSISVTTPNGSTEALAIPLNPRLYLGDTSAALDRAKEQYKGPMTTLARLAPPVFPQPGQADVYFKFFIANPSVGGTQRYGMHIVQQSPSIFGGPPSSLTPTLKLTANLKRVSNGTPLGTLLNTGYTSIPTQLVDSGKDYRYHILNVDLAADDSSSIYVLKLHRPTVSDEQKIRVGIETDLRMILLKANAFKSISDNDDFPGDLDEPMGKMVVDYVERYLLYKNIDENQKFLKPFAWLDSQYNQTSNGLFQPVPNNDGLVQIRFSKFIALDWGEHDTVGNAVPDYVEDIKVAASWYHDTFELNRSSLDYEANGLPRACLFNSSCGKSTQDMHPNAGYFFDCVNDPEADVGNFDCDARYDFRYVYSLPN